MFNQVVYLIPFTETVTGMGVTIKSEDTKRPVFCSVSTVGMKENFEGVQAGIKPVYRVKIADRLDYQDETLCEFEGERFEIYRTYFKGIGHGLELYLQRRAGVTNG